jgi:hypothetical protein
MRGALRINRMTPVGILDFQGPCRLAPADPAAPCNQAANFFCCRGIRSRVSWMSYGGRD